MVTPASTQTIADEQGGGLNGAVNRLLGGFISFSRWPARARDNAVSLCTVGQPALANELRPAVPGGLPPVTRWKATLASLESGQPCDVVYFARLPIAERRRLIDWVRYRPILTVTDDDPQCLSGAAFCLFRTGEAIGFSVNVDSIARSKVAVDPRVLQIGRAGNGGRP